MSFKNSLYMFMLGVMGTLLYQGLKSGDLRKMVREMNRSKTKFIEDMEDLV